MSEPTFGPVTIRPAVEADLPHVLRSITSAAQWTQDRGQRGWPVPFPEEIVRPSLERGELYVAIVGGEIGGSFVLRWNDEAFWGPQPPNSGYLHQLAVRRDRALRGLGRRLVARAEAITRERGRPFLRLDCVADNEPLIAYYEALGFHRVRAVPYPPDPSFDVQLMEKPLG